MKRFYTTFIKITIGENIIHIEDFAFMDAKELEKITVNKNNKNYLYKYYNIHLGVKCYNFYRIVIVQNCNDSHD